MAVAKEAYKVQVSVLRMIGASPNLINGVMRSAKDRGPLNVKGNPERSKKGPPFLSLIDRMVRI